MASVAKLVDFDKVSSLILSDMKSAVKGWLSGSPTEEIALLNRITEKLKKHPANCDVGIRYRMSAESKCYILHRRGLKQSDLYGSDLALSLYVENACFLKTAFFQLKKSKKHKLSLEKKQLSASQKHPDIGPNSFVISVDEICAGIRIYPALDLLNEIPPSNESKSYDTTDWWSLTEWIIKWLSCDVGQDSKPNNKASVESELSRYTLSDNFDVTVPWVDQNPESSDSELVPARAWLITSIAGSEDSPNEDIQLPLLDG